MHPIRFLAPEIDRLTAMAESYDGSLVVVSFLIAALAGYAALSISDRIRSAIHAPARNAWLVTGAITMGIGIWAMHFIGMLAYALPVPINYDVGGTLVSIIPGIIASGVALYVLAAEEIRIARLVAGGTVMGLGIGAMHYAGMAALQFDALVYYDANRFVLSIFAAIGLAIAALYLKYRIVRRRAGAVLVNQLGSALVLGLAVTTMHYVGMTAAYCIPSGTQIEQAGAFDDVALAALVGLTTALILALSIMAGAVDRRLGAAYADVRETRSLLTNASDSIPDGLAIFNADGRLTLANAALREIFPGLGNNPDGRSHYDDVLANQFETSDTADASGPIRFEELLGRSDNFSEREELLKDGRRLLIRDSRTPSGGLVVGIADVTEARKLQFELEQMALHDALTGLPNRNLFYDRLTLAAAQAERQDGRFSLLFVDLDNFKPINDSLGHEAGDIVLQTIADRLSAALRATDTAARTGGDEFAAILPGADETTAEHVGKRILDKLCKPITYENNECVVSASIGIAMYPKDSTDPEHLVRLADEAMYRSKDDGRNRYTFYQASQNERGAAE